jgi:hypothetical protein
VTRRNDLARSITTDDDLRTHGYRVLSGHAPMRLRERDLCSVIKLITKYKRKSGKNVPPI